MLRTNREIKMNFKGVDIVVPAGQPVSKCPDSTGQYFVEHFDNFIDKRKQAMLYHDATHYGIRVDGTDVGDVPVTA